MTQHFVFKLWGRQWPRLGGIRDQKAIPPPFYHSKKYVCTSDFLHFKFFFIHVGPKLCIFHFFFRFSRILFRNICLTRNEGGGGFIVSWRSICEVRICSYHYYKIQLLALEWSENKYCSFFDEWIEFVLFWRKNVCNISEDNIKIFPNQS